MLTPIIDRLATQFAGKVKVGKLNVDDQQELAVKYGVMSIPRVFIFKNGEQKQSLLGLRSEAELTQALNGVLEA
jgi:thioredoxin 1